MDAVDKAQNRSKYEDAQLKGALESLQQSLDKLGGDTEMYRILLRNLISNEESAKILAR